jgi:general secretion pathway protein K
MSAPHRQHNFHVSQRGVALVTALLVVALATVAAVAMATRLHVDMRRAGNLLHGEQAYTYALAAESWAQVILQRDSEDNKTDSYQDDWATSLPPIAVEGGLVDGRIDDLQGRFNVNNLVGDNGAVDAPNLKYFEQLLERLQLEPSLATALVDWIDSDLDVTFPGGVEDETYLLQDPPYRAANRRLVDISELRLVQGFTPEIIEILAPHVTALPSATLINVNTATPEVLLALHVELDPTDIDTLIAMRDEEVFETADEFLAADALAGLTLVVSVGVDSDWFRVLTDVVVGAGRARLNSLLFREGAQLQVVMRTRARHFLLPPENNG